MVEPASGVLIPIAEKFSHTFQFACRISVEFILPGATPLVFAVNGESHRHEGPALTYKLQIKEIAPSYPALQLLTFTDARQPHVSGWMSVTPGPHHLVVVGQRATGPKSSDGVAQVWVDGQSQLFVKGLPLYWRHYPETIEINPEIVDKDKVTQLHLEAYMGPVVLRRR